MNPLLTTLRARMTNLEAPPILPNLSPIRLADSTPRYMVRLLGNAIFGILIELDGSIT